MTATLNMVMISVEVCVGTDSIMTRMGGLAWLEMENYQQMVTMNANYITGSEDLRIEGAKVELDGMVEEMEIILKKAIIMVMVEP